MNRRIRIILLAISLLLVIGTLGWLTHVLLVQAEETGHSEQRIRVEALAHEAKLEMDRLLTSFITFEQARGYFEYQPVYAYKRPYDLRMGAPAPGEATRGSNLAAYLPDYVTAFIQISPAGRVTGPALPPELAGRLNEQKDLYQRLNGKVSSLTSVPSSGNLWTDIRNEILHESPEPEPTISGAPAQVETVTSFGSVEDGGNLYILRQVHTSRGIYLQGALMNMDNLNRRLPGQVKMLLPHSRLATFDPSSPPPEETRQAGALPFANAPLVFLPGDAGAVPLQDHKKMLTWTLTLIWSMVLLGAAGVIWLMLGTFRLEQRRGDFVSAVTHELRTPLTSFSLYTEMLEDGMVPEQKKPEYYANMQRECRRLEHLIENVLSYSRLQRNAIRRARDTLTCQELPDGYDLTVTAPEQAAGVTAHLRDGASALAFDDIILPAGDLNGAGLTPLTALPYVVQAIRSGYVDLTWTEDGLQVVQLITDDHTAVRLYLDGTVPQCAELSVDDTLCLRCTMENWNLEQGSMNDESQDPNLGRDQSQ